VKDGRFIQRQHSLKQLQTAHQSRACLCALQLVDLRCGIHDVARQLNVGLAQSLDLYGKRTGNGGQSCRRKHNINLKKSGAKEAQQTEHQQRAADVENGTARSSALDRESTDDARR
jgi:hypothetical protein